MPSMTRRRLWWKLLLYPTHTLPTAAAPVLVAVGLAAHDHVFAPRPAALAFVASWLIHVAGVFTDNNALLRRHPSLAEHPELLQAVADRTLTLTTLKVAIALCLILSALVAIPLLQIGGLIVLVIGVLGVVASLSYHGGPFAYAPRGLADPVFFLMFGVVAVAATYYIQALSLAGSPDPWPLRWTPLPWRALVVGLPIGALTTNVLVMDDLRDRTWDAAKGWRTGAVRWGPQWSRAEFTGLMLFAYLAPLVFCWGLGLGRWTLLPLLTTPFAVQAVKSIWRLEAPAALLPWSSRVATLGAGYAAFLAVGLAQSAR